MVIAWLQVRVNVVLSPCYNLTLVALPGLLHHWSLPGYRSVYVVLVTDQESHPVASPSLLHQLPGYRSGVNVVLSPGL